MSKYLRLAGRVGSYFAGNSYRNPNLVLNTRLFHLGRSTMMKYITQAEAIAIDVALFMTYKFSLEQLMELAGLSCAVSIYKCYAVEKYLTVLVLCGPGNNGGDGLVCARHLKLFGFKTEVYYPKKNQNVPFKNLLEQCQGMDIPIHETLPDINFYDMAVDAIFGFSFKPPVRAEYCQAIEELTNTRVTICSIDIPSGWDVETGCPEEGGISPDLLVSLTAPKKGVSKFSGKYHFLGGRFVPPKLARQYQLALPNYPTTECCMDITGWEDLPDGAF